MRDAVATLEQTQLFRPGVWDKGLLREAIEAIIEQPGTAKDKADRIIDILGTYKVIR